MSGRLLTCYAPLRRSPSMDIAVHNAAPRLACVKPAASVHPEPGSNSSLYNSLYLFVCPASLTLLALLLFACLYLFPQPFQSTSNIFRFLIPCGPPFVWGLQRYAFFVSYQIFLRFFTRLSFSWATIDALRQYRGRVYAPVNQLLWLKD